MGNIQGSTATYNRAGWPENMSREEIIAEKRRLTERSDASLRKWPVDFRWNDSPTAELMPHIPGPSVKVKSTKTIGQKFRELPMNIRRHALRYPVRAFGVFPGATRMANYALVDKPEDLLAGRAVLNIELGAERFKLETREGEFIDGIFIDRRDKPTGHILEILFNGNAGLFEASGVETLIEHSTAEVEQFSLIRWNYPGYGYSTGTPTPETVLLAADTVMRYALDKLGFNIGDIFINGFSVGGFPASWVAARYPFIRGLILDATFDKITNVLGIMVAREQGMGPIARLIGPTLEKFYNLNNLVHLTDYPGPVLFIRRLDDAVMSKSRNPSTNLTNNLLIHVLTTRYPKLFEDYTMDELETFLYSRKYFVSSVGATFPVFKEFVENFVRNKRIGPNSWVTFPTDFGEGMSREDRVKALLFLADVHLVNINVDHADCTCHRCVRRPAMFLFDFQAMIRLVAMKVADIVMDVYDDRMPDPVTPSARLTGRAWLESINFPTASRSESPDPSRTRMTDDSMRTLKSFSMSSFDKSKSGSD